MAVRDHTELWEQHVRGEFVDKEEKLSLFAMIVDASVLHVAPQLGGQGKDEI